MTKYNKIKQILTVFRNDNNDARIKISLDEYSGKHNEITFKYEVKFDSEFIEDIDVRMFITFSKEKFSIGAMSILANIDYIIQAMSLESFNNEAIEVFFKNILETLKWNTEAKLNAEKIYKK